MLYCLRAIKLNLLPTTPFLVYIHGTRLTFGKPFVGKQCNVLVFLIVVTKGVEVPIKLSEDYYCDLSVPMPNGYTINEEIMLVYIFKVCSMTFGRVLSQ